MRKKILLSKIGMERLQSCVPTILENIHKFFEIDIKEDDVQDLSFIVEVNIKDGLNEYIKGVVNKVVQELKDEFK